MMRGLRQSADYILIFQFLILGENFFDHQYSFSVALRKSWCRVCMITAHIILLVCWYCVFHLHLVGRQGRHPLTHSRGALTDTPPPRRCCPAAAAAGYDYQYCRLLMIILFSASQTRTARRGERLPHRPSHWCSSAHKYGYDTSAHTQSLDLPTRLDCPLSDRSLRPDHPEPKGWLSLSAPGAAREHFGRGVRKRCPE